MIDSVTPPSSTSSDPDSKKKPGYHLVILYEDIVTGKRANRFCENLVCELDEAAVGIKDLWSFKVLDIPHVRREAAEAAARADVVILALHGHDDLPDGVKIWMEHWSGRMSEETSDKGPILVALFGAADDKYESVASIRAFLGGITETAGLPFLHTRQHPIVQDPLAA